MTLSADFSVTLRPVAVVAERHWPHRAWLAVSDRASFGRIAIASRSLHVVMQSSE
jgi:hypothetical protein